MTWRRLARWVAWVGGSGLGVLLLSLGTLCLTSGCSSVGYLWQSAGGHLSLLHSARPVNDWVQDPQTDAALRERLQLSQRMRDFAIQELDLPDNRSYRRYADLHRGAAVWNVVAAPELSLTLQTWCFPVVGCVGYRGYFDEAAAQTAGDALRTEGLEVSVYPVPAYSTLGMSNWLGGDPLLNTFIRWPEGELARLIFHELSHQVVYAAGDTAFNESFATTVEQIGAQRWLNRFGDEAARREYAALEQRRQDFRALTGRTRAALLALYASPLGDEAKRQRKAALFAQMRADYAALRDGPWQGFAGYDRFFSQANNASLGVLGAYLQWVPAFQALFLQEGENFPRFYAAVQRLADQPKPERERALQALMPAAAASAATSKEP
ncbi:aminopeptidase [Ideonella dechloratans]|uniref:Aminopeptidase n=1 Tax=Ideonella dechloratans TaxID=36863 RepID=A0A643FID8_IDEDE|nr:aminopeptidase [Ideonella dechloratans]KAB0584421.1 aminopeptidase [Ideonella dechloratans]UFU10861.1 aminopeptidase [Ideonella dechloratans]